MSNSAIQDLCEIVERLHAENPTMGRLAFTIPDVARIELVFVTTSEKIADEDSGAKVAMS